jgi:hypothetical protein
VASQFKWIRRAWDWPGADQNLKDYIDLRDNELEDYLNTPVPRCRVYNSAAIPLTTGVGTALTFDALQYDNAALHSLTVNTGRITPNQAGLWRVGANLAFAANAVGVRTVDLRAFSASLGTTIVIASDYKSAASAGEHRVSLTTDYQVKVGDYFDVFVAQNSGGTLNVQLGNFYSAMFWATFVDN